MPAIVCSLITRVGVGSTPFDRAPLLGVASLNNPEERTSDREEHLKDVQRRRQTTISFHVGRFFGILVAVAGVAAVALAGEIDSIGRGLGLIAVAFTLSLVIELAIPLWPNRMVPFLLASIILFFVALSVFSWFIFLKDRDRPQLEPYTSAQTLLTFVGDDIARTCKVFVNNAFFVGERAAIECSPPGLISFDLALFDSTEAMNEDFVNTAGSLQGLKAGDIEDCKSGKSIEGEWQSAADTRQTTAGRFMCYLDDENDAWMQWAYDDHKIYAFAIRDDNNASALYEWWNRFWAIKA
jgi:hypothetical protein